MSDHEKLLSYAQLSTRQRNEARAAYDQITNKSIRFGDWVKLVRFIIRNGHVKVKV